MRRLSESDRVADAAGRAVCRSWPKPLPFFALVFGLSLPFWLAGWLTELEFLPRLPVSALMAACPLLAAVLLTRAERGRDGLMTLLRRAIRPPRGRRALWLIPALLLFPALLALSGAIEVTPAATGMRALPMVLAFLAAAMFEEMGWSGYPTDPLQQRSGALGAGLIIGAIWAAWHVVPYLQAGRAWDWIAWQSGFSIAARVILVRIYGKAGRSVPVAALAHATINVAVFLLPADSGAYDPRAAALATGLMAVMASALWRRRPFS